ncbi:MAG: DEAD/DEAH box helicase [Vulcanimicrobiaceae bacterium]
MQDVPVEAAVKPDAETVTAIADSLIHLASVQIYGVKDNIGLANSDVALGYSLGNAIAYDDYTDEQLAYAAHLVGYKYRRQTAGFIGSLTMTKIAKLADDLREIAKSQLKTAVKLEKNDDGVYLATFTGGKQAYLAGLNYTYIHHNMHKTINKIAFASPSDCSQFVKRIQKTDHSRVYADKVLLDEIEQAKITHELPPLEVSEDGEVLYLKFPYMPDAVSAVRKINGRSFNGDTKEWSIGKNHADKAYLAFQAVQDHLDLSALESHLSMDASALLAQQAEGGIDMRESIEVALERGKAWVSFPYNEGLVEAIKDVSGCKFDGQTKRWSIPKEGLLALEATFAEYEHTHNLDSYRQALEIVRAQVTQERLESEEAFSHDDPIAVDTDKLACLRPYQVDGVHYLTRSEASIKRAINAEIERTFGGPIKMGAPFGVILGDDMGLGKTPQAAIAADAVAGTDPILVVCPATLKRNWEREIHKFVGENERVQVLGATDPIDPSARWLIINYDIIEKQYERLRDLKPAVVVFDEAHYIKNYKARRSVFCVGGKLSTGDKLEQITGLASLATKRTFLLTGTPMPNRVRDLGNLLRAVGHPIAKNKHHFEEQYCNGHTEFVGRDVWVNDGATNIDELRKVVSPVLIARRKRDVLEELPAKSYQVIPLEVNLAEYKRVLAEYGRKAQHNPLTALTAARMATAKAKAPLTASYVSDIANEQNKVVIFSMSTQVLDMLQKAIKLDEGGEVVRLDGTMTANQRQLAIDRFQGDPRAQVFLGQMQAAGVGITLTAAQTLIFNDIGFIPGEVKQAQDRIHRIGQEKAVNIVFMAADQTLDGEQINRVIGKLDVTNDFEGGTKENEELLAAMRRALNAACGVAEDEQPIRGQRVRPSAIAL